MTRSLNLEDLIAERNAKLELDRRIATEIFGESEQHYHRSGADQPSYSGSMDGAWYVMEFLRRLGFGLSLYDIEEDGIWELEVMTPKALYEAGYRGCFRNGPDVPRLICEAALYSIQKHEDPDAE